MLKYWLLAIRPKTLSIAVVPVLLGSTLGWVETGDLIWPAAVAALFGAVLIQIGTNLHNDAADYERGADRSDMRFGPPRATAEGWLSAQQVKRAALLSFVAAGLIGCYLIWLGGWPILVVGVVSIAAGLAYTGGPRPIAYSAFGEGFVWLFFGLVAVGGSYYLQVGRLSWAAVLLGAIIGMPAAAVLVVNNYRDLETDRRVGKNTLAVRFGANTSQWVYASLIYVPFVLVLCLPPLIGGGAWLFASWLVLPWAVVLVRRLRKERPGPVLNPLLADTARFQLAFGLLLCLGLVAGRGLPSMA